MFKTSLFALTVLASLCTVTYADQSLIQHEGEQIGWSSMFSLPQDSIDDHFRAVKRQVEDRWDLLGAHHNFPLYAPGKDENSIVEEFYQFSDLRLHLWFRDHKSFPCECNPLFKISQEHLLKRRFRQPNCLTFEHSATDSSYNSSSLQIGKRRFFALEGPLEEHVTYFFSLLTNWRVAHLVRLTGDCDSSGTPKCYPYWQDRIVQKECATFLRIPVIGSIEISPSSWGTKEILYEVWPDWQDHHGVDPQRLIEAANRVRKGIAEDEIIAVHCSAGVGRTGTFIASICILDAIDEQLAQGIDPHDVRVSIAKLFLYLNFHRPWMVAKPGQYLTLYRMAEWYLHEKIS